MNSGLLYAAVAYCIWGLFPMYFKAVQQVPSLQVLMHRAVWSLVFLLILLTIRRHWAWLGRALRDRKVLACFAASGLLLSLNWFVYIWATTHDRVIDASLGYFMTPLVNILLGLVILRERLRAFQWAAVGFAAAGVAWLTWHSNSPPWISIILAATFGTYGLLRKTAPLGTLEGLTLETILMLPIASIYLIWLSATGGNAFSNAPTSTQLLLAAAGPITAVPLLMFAAGARRISLSLLGLLQYITPTIQLSLGVLLYHEPFDAIRLTGFALIWAGLAVYSVESLWRHFAIPAP